MLVVRSWCLGWGPWGFLCFCSPIFSALISNGVYPWVRLLGFLVSLAVPRHSSGSLSTIPTLANVHFGICLPCFNGFCRHVPMPALNLFCLMEHGGWRGSSGQCLPCPHDGLRVWCPVSKYHMHMVWPIVVTQAGVSRES